MTRSNARALWRCKPCAAAEVAINNSVKGVANKELRSALTNMKEKDPDMWRYKVRRARIVDFRIPGGGQVGVNSIVEREQAVCTFTGFLRQVASLELRAPDSWLLKTEFVRWMQDHRDYSKEDAVREWDRREK